MALPGLAHLSRRLCVLVLVALVLSQVACGGGGKTDDSKPISEKEASEAADRFFLVSFGLLTGDARAQQLIDSFLPECRSEVDAAELETSLALVRAFVPDLDEIHIEEVDVGDVTVEQTDNGTLVRPVDVDALRVKLGGKFVNANDLFESIGMSSSDDEADAEPVLMARRDGKIYIADCSQLGGFFGE